MHERVPSHENLVEFICAWEERDLLYIQTELCEMSLESHLHKYGALPEWRIWDVLLDLTKVSNYLIIYLTYSFFRQYIIWTN
jgi:membrane-associated tyrosine/threonine-specific cdc2-inhibitory kinase